MYSYILLKVVPGDECVTSGIEYIDAKLIKEFSLGEYIDTQKKVMHFSDYNLIRIEHESDIKVEELVNYDVYKEVEKGETK